jgi:DNA repair protein RecN (Recombination protein N)
VLKQLFIKDFAIIDRLDLDLAPGMTALTGETGAGKSIVIGALHLVLGGRASTDVIRAGSDTAEVSATFRFEDPGVRERVSARLREQDIPLDDDELLVRRIVSRSGRNKIYVNGTLVTAAVLSALTGDLVDITGQHEHVWLLQPETQLELLDAFGGLGPQVAEVQAQYEHAREIHDEIRRMRQGEQEVLAREDYLSFQVRELREAGPLPGEEQQLAKDRKRLAGAERLRLAVASAEETLYSGEHAAVELLGGVKDSLSQLADIDDGLGPLARSLAEAQTVVEDVSRSLQRLLSRVQVDPEKLAVMDDRLELIRRLARKHGCVPDGLPGKLADLELELEGITHRDEKLRQLEKDLAVAKGALTALCVDLSDKRKKGALRMAHATLEEVATLGMEQASLQFAVEPLPARGETADLFLEPPDGPPRRVSARGMDRVEMRICANPGEEMKPLSRIASGGELSRLLLAIKRVMAQRDPVPVYVFDEVDAGVGGAMGEAIGLKIRGVSQMRQALCVTHLPQIAAHADHHFVVEKEVEGGRTVSRVRRLGNQERAEELARMLGGLAITDATRAHAREMLKAARAAP